MLLNQYSGAFCITVAGVALPVYRSFKCLQSEEDTAKQWLPYWLIWALFSVCESLLDLVFGSWFPLWFEIKLGFVIALQPGFLDLAATLYHKKLESLLSSSAPTIDERLTLIGAGWKALKANPSAAGLKSFGESFGLSTCVEMVRTRVAGLSSAAAAVEVKSKPAAPSPTTNAAPTVDASADTSGDASGETSTILEAPASPEHHSGSSDEPELVEPLDLSEEMKKDQ